MAGYPEAKLKHAVEHGILTRDHYQKRAAKTFDPAAAQLIGGLQ